MPQSTPSTLRAVARELQSGHITARALLESCLDRIADPQGEGKTAFLKVHDRDAKAAADEIDRKRKAGASLPLFAGIPVSIKDLFDVAGDVTRAGSVVLNDAAPAARDCPAVARMREAGFVIAGRTNMTEFAFSGLGLNPHFGTPRNPWQRNRGRIPGGSSSGAAISVTDGMAFCGLGSDTGGSCRIPAALTGLTGWKPTALRIPLEGVLPLSFSLDSVGCLAPTVDDCSIVDSIMAGEAEGLGANFIPATRIRLAIPQTLALDGMDAPTERAFQRALSMLSAAGVAVADIPLTELGEIPSLNAKGGFPSAEGYAWHRKRLETHGHLYDPRVSVRLRRGQEQSAADYIDLLHGRADLIQRVTSRLEGIDALVLPTVPVIAPLIAELDDEAEYTRLNLLLLRNPTFANFLDGCSISVPMHEQGECPAGFMLIALAGRDSHLLAVARSVEAILAGSAAG